MQRLRNISFVAMIECEMDFFRKFNAIRCDLLRRKTFEFDEIIIILTKSFNIQKPEIQPSEKRLNLIGF